MGVFRGASPSFQQRYVQCVSPCGLHRMAYTEWGEPDNPRVLMCVHGLTRSGRDFDPLAAALADHYRVVCPDVAGRGLSDWLADPLLYGAPQYVADMVTLIARLNVDTLDWFGASMGGLIGLMLGGLPGSPVRKLLLNDIGPHIDMAGLARLSAYVGKPVQFATQQQGVDYLATLAQTFGSLTPDEWRIINTPLLRQRDDGQWEPRYDPAITLAFSHITPETSAAGEAALWRSLEAMRSPVLVARGEHSDLLTRETLSHMVTRGHAVSSVEIAGAGHAPAFVCAQQIGIARRFFVGDAVLTA